MARQIWSGSLSFGLVNVPVGLVSATEQKDVSFHQRESGTNARIRYKRVAEGSDHEVDYEDIVKGYELGSDTFVTLTQEEVDAASLGKSRSLEISNFVDLAEIDPVYYEKSYYLAPRDDSAHQAYALLRDAMERTGLAGIGSFVMRGKENLAIIRPWKRVLVLETLLFADEVRDPHDLMDDLPSARKGNSREMEAAVNLIEQLTTPWKPERYSDTYREHLLGMVKDKAKGREISVEKSEPTEDNIVDLMDALQRSVDEAKGGSSSKRKTSGGRSKGSRSRSGRSTSRQSASTSSRRRAKVPSDVDTLSKQELYKLATDLGVEGRSKMTRAQLEGAIKKAS